MLNSNGEPFVYLPLPEDDTPEEEYLAFEDGFQALTGIRLHLYKEKQMKRRIRTLIQRKGLESFDAFLQRLREDPAELAAFVDYITINVTEFFRTPDHWRQMETEALTALCSQQKTPLKIWSCACATGEEAWSLAISLSELTDPSRFHILATDLDAGVLKTAEKGVYGERAMDGVPDDICGRYFVRTDTCWRVSDTLRPCVEFRQMDLLRDDYPSQCDLIVCRNVLIYFTEEAKDTIYAQFHRSLAPGGYLFTGDTEQIIYYKKFGYKKLRNYLYCKD